MRIDIFNDNISYVTDEVSTVPTCLANYSQENREKFVTDLAAVSRGKTESKNPSVRFNSLLTEAACGTPSRPMEFLPILVKYELVDNGVMLKLNYATKIEAVEFCNNIAKFSYLENGYLYTNLRCLINAGIPYEIIPFNTSKEELAEMKKFKALRLNTPMFIWAQVPNTHTQISKEAQSDRVADNYHYWLPEDLSTRLAQADENSNKVILDFKYYCYSYQQKEFYRNSFISKMLEDYTQEQVQTLLKDLGYKREIWSRAPYYFKYKECVMTGWYNDPHVWQHLFLERGAKPDIWKNWTQAPTAKVVKAICSVVEMGEVNEN